MPDILDEISSLTQEDRNAAADILDEISSLTQDDGIGQVADLIRDGEYDEHDTVQRTARHRQAGVQQGLDMAAEAGRAGIYQLTDEGFVVGCCEFRESHADDMAGAVAAAIRKLGGDDA